MPLLLSLLLLLLLLSLLLLLLLSLLLMLLLLLLLLLLLNAIWFRLLLPGMGCMLLLSTSTSTALRPARDMAIYDRR
jgi:hypothetical protein